jgi:hypothetical protein
VPGHFVVRHAEIGVLLEHLESVVLLGVAEGLGMLQTGMLYHTTLPLSEAATPTTLATTAVNFMSSGCWLDLCGLSLPSAPEPAQRNFPSSEK